MESTLNAEQAEAVETTEGYVRVIAGAGSGKTRALTHRYAFLVNTLGILPANILCVTFTNKAAGEMRRRIHELIGDQDTAFINTFHGFCVSVLKEEAHAVQYPRAFLVLDNSDIDDILRIVYEERGLTLRDKSFADARDMIEIQKIFKRPAYYLDMLDLSLDALRERYLKAAGTDDIIFYGYLYQQKKCFGLDYNDLIIVTLHIFEHKEDIRLKWQKRLEYIMIDEFQDIDSLQYRLMEVLCGYHGNLFVVGDPDQTIYTWRGANIKYLLDLHEHFKPLRTVMMMRNYRSVPPILEAANSLIAKNARRMEKTLLPVRSGGSRVLFRYAKSSRDEAEWIARKIRTMHGGGIPYRDMAILYRANYLTRSLEEVFLAEKLPYHIFNGIQFFARAEIKDALCLLRMVYSQDDLSFRRIANRPRRNIGRRRMDFLEGYAGEHGCTLYAALKKTLDHEIFRGTRAAQFVELIDGYSAVYDGMPVSELLAFLLDRSGYEAMLRLEGSQERLDNLAELKQSVRDYEILCGEEATLEHYLAHVALLTGSDDEERSDKVRMMTVHAAKGLEFPHVFLCGLNEGVFPSRKIRTLDAMEEERRLAFVAMTRARDSLFLSGAEGRHFDGSLRYPSRFVLDVEGSLLEFENKPDESLAALARGYIAASEQFLAGERQGAAFAVDSRVRHEHFGPGTVIGIDTELSAYIIRFDGTKTPRAISFRVRLMPE